MINRQRVLIVDDHTLIRQGLKDLLSANSELEIVGETGNGREAINLVASTGPKLVLMDLSLPGTNGIEAILEIRRRTPTVRILVLTMHTAEEYVRGALKAGANGYVLKHSTAEELMLAIKSVMNGNTYLSPEISQHVISGYLDSSNGIGDSSIWDSVTLREREILRLVAEGHPNKYIADYLCLSVKTVDKHRSNLMKKLNLHNAASLTAFAISKGMLEVS